MIYDDRDRMRVRNAVLVVTALAWILTLSGAIGTRGISSAHVYHPVMNHDVSLVAVINWLIMLTAMMAPILIPPIQFMRGSALERRRPRATVLFVAGYAAVWVFAGLWILMVVASLESSGFPPVIRAVAVVILALVWQCSPAKQLCLNRCHLLRAPAAFGRAAYVDGGVSGAIQGEGCTGACWPLMLLQMVLPSVHIFAMAGSTILIICERLDDPAIVRWRWPTPGRAFRIASAWFNPQTQRTRHTSLPLSNL